MYYMKKAAAMALAATMVFGSSLTAFADESVSSNSVGSSTGSGTSEGHVEEKATNVVLPVEDTDFTADTFAYTMDPEGLIAATDGGKYTTGTVFPESDDTGVYFLTATNTYGNASSKLTVTNKSSHDISLTVKAEVSTATDATDIPMVAKDALDAAEDASLYLGLVVDDGTGIAITKEAAATSTVTVAGKADNFEIVVNSGEYQYAEKSSAEGWGKSTFGLEGAVTSGIKIEDATTAPAVTVTWSWVDPTLTPETPATPEIALSGTYSRASTANTFTLTNMGSVTITKVEATYEDGSVIKAMDSTMYTIDENQTVMTVNGTTAPWGTGAVGKVRGIKITLDDDQTVQTTFTVQS